MPLRKLPDPEWWSETVREHCRHPEHRPPNMIVLEPGVYEHTCPACGATTQFVVPPRSTLIVHPTLTA